MSEYIFILLWIGACGLVSNTAHLKRYSIVYGVEKERYLLLFSIIIFAPVIIMAGNRDLAFVDTYAYVGHFAEMPSNFDSLPEYLSTQNKDTGFYLLSSLIKILITKDPRVYLWIIALFQGIVVIWFFRNFSDSYILAVFLFVASTDMVSWMYNGIRQFLAVVIILLATPYILRKKYVIAILFILFASTMHLSALLMIPVIFIVQGDAWNKRTIFFLGLVVLVFVFANQFTNFLNDSLSDTQYKNIINDSNEMNDNGTNVLRVMVYSIPAIFSFIYKGKINQSGDRLVIISANMSIITAGLYIVSMVSSGIFIGRLPIYCSLYGYILLIWCINEMEINNKRFFLISMIILYLIIYYYQMSVTWAMF